MPFTAMTLPKQMRFKPPKAADWFAEYAWAAFPESLAPAAREGAAAQPGAAAAALNSDLAAVGAKENKQINGRRTATKSNLKNTRAGSAVKSVKFD